MLWPPQRARDGVEPHPTEIGSRGLALRAVDTNAGLLLLAMNVKRDWSDPGEVQKAGVRFDGAQV
ncbi:MAG: hypothetical protein AAF968_27355 [Pseudomonadota bacterium]